MTDLPDFPSIPLGDATPISRRNSGYKTLIVYNPDLDAKTVARLQATDWETLINGPAQKELSGVTRFLKAIGKPHMMLFTVIFPASSFTIASATHHQFEIVAASYVFASAAIGVEMYKTKPTGKLLSHAGTGYVHAQWLLPDHAALLESALRAQIAIEKSNVVQQDIVDATKVRIRMPQILWDIAHTLHETSGLRAELTSLKAADSAQNKALQLVETAVKRRVTALETCASQVREADRAYSELIKQQTVEGMDSRIMNLVARASIEDVALNEIREISAQATAAADAFKKAKFDAIAALDAAFALEA